MAIEKDAATSYTERVMQQAASAVAIDKLSDQDYEKLMQQKWQKMLAESASRIAHKPAPVGHSTRASWRNSATTTSVYSYPRMD